MADTFLQAHGPRVRETIVATGSHPLPNRGSVESGERALQLATDARARGDCVIVLLSGGASAMMAVPSGGISLDDKIAVTTLLLRSGLPISDLNAVRKHISRIKGGQLAAAAGRSVTYAISDVHAPIENDPAVIGSGPTVGDPSTFADARDALIRGGLWDALPAAIRARLETGVRGDLAETVKPADPRLRESAFVLAGSRQDAIRGAATEARSLGYHVVVLDRPTLGEAREAAAEFCRRAVALAASPPPLCVIAAGETTVTVVSGGKGGRNQEFALAAATAIASLGNLTCASVGTDGIDGPTDAAGAVADATTLSRARAQGLDPAAALRGHDAYPFFRALGDLIVTGPTGTNVGDLQVMLVE